MADSVATQTSLTSPEPSLNPAPAPVARMDDSKLMNLRKHARMTNVMKSRKPVPARIQTRPLIRAVKKLVAKPEVQAKMAQLRSLRKK